MRLLLVALLLLSAPGALAQLPAPEDIKQRWSQRLDRVHFTAVIRLEVDFGTKREERRLRVWRIDEGGQESLLARFEEPPDLRGLGLLYVENKDRSNDYFLYQPSLDRVRRIPESLAREDVYGVDLEYLGFGVAQIEPTQVEAVEAVTLDGRPALRLSEKAKRRDARFEVRRIWLDPASLVAIRCEHQRGGKATLVAVTERIDTVQGVVTPMRVRFERPVDRQVVAMTVEEVDYETPVPDAVFSTLSLIKRR